MAAAGASVDAKTHFGYTALHLAAAQARPKPLAALLAAGAAVEAQENNGLRPIHLAAMFDKGMRYRDGDWTRMCQQDVATIIQALVAAGADVSSIGGEGQVTPLHSAAGNQYGGVAEAATLALLQASLFACPPSCLPACMTDRMI